MLDYFSDLENEIDNKVVHISSTKLIFSVSVTFTSLSEPTSLELGSIFCWLRRSGSFGLDTSGMGLWIPKLLKLLARLLVLARKRMFELVLTLIMTLGFILSPDENFHQLIKSIRLENNKGRLDLAIQTILEVMHLQIIVWHDGWGVSSKLENLDK